MSAKKCRTGCEKKHEMSDEQVPPPGGNPLEALTLKQREVLEFIMEHKTSKEISRLLGISPHTVDQRVTQARAKLGMNRRGEVASEYRRLKTIYEEDGASCKTPGLNLVDFAPVATCPADLGVAGSFFC